MLGSREIETFLLRERINLILLDQIPEGDRRFFQHNGSLTTEGFNEKQRRMNLVKPLLPLVNTWRSLYFKDITENDYLIVHDFIHATLGCGPYDEDAPGEIEVLFGVFQIEDALVWIEMGCPKG